LHYIKILFYANPGNQRNGIVDHSMMWLGFIGYNSYMVKETILK